MWFEAFSGLRINLSKSEIFLARGIENVEDFVAELGCKVGSLPSKYLGLPLGSPHKSDGVWDPIEERFRKRLVAWKHQYISKGGGLPLSVVLCQVFLFTSCPFFESQAWFARGWKKIREISCGEEEIWIKRRIL